MAKNQDIMTPAQIAEIAEREAKATAGPWHHSITGSHDDPDYSITQTNHITRDVWTIPHCLDDVPFVAHSRADIPRLLSHAAAQAARIEELEKAMREIDSNRGGEANTAYALHRKLIQSANIARTALKGTP